MSNEVFHPGDALLLLGVAGAEFEVTYVKPGRPGFAWVKSNDLGQFPAEYARLRADPAVCSICRRKHGPETVHPCE